MIGHFLLQLTPEQEDRVLTQTMGPRAGPVGQKANRCLIHRAANNVEWEPIVLGGLYYWSGPARIRDFRITHVGWRYDFLCARFGTPRINAAIRNRILSQRAYRTLSVGASVEVHP